MAETRSRSERIRTIRHAYQAAVSNEKGDSGLARKFLTLLAEKDPEFNDLVFAEKIDSDEAERLRRDRYFEVVGAITFFDLLVIDLDHKVEVVQNGRRLLSRNSSYNQTRHDLIAGFAFLVDELEGDKKFGYRRYPRELVKVLKRYCPWC
ncbi:MAG: hypothetical protein AAF393_12435 [Pseudomonadota bacterium]